MNTELLALAFFLTALIYSSVGFGGGSTYNALLVLALADLAAVPVIALACNIVVVTVGMVRFGSAGHIDWRRFWPLALLSIPAAWLGGFIHVPPWLFVGLLALALGLAGILLLLPVRREPLPEAPSGRAVDLATGAGLGLVAGLTGIGGGIYLSPVLHLRRWGNARLIAGTSALFILVNSVSGLAGQVMKTGAAGSGALLLAHWPLLPAVLLGGIVGSQLGSRILPERTLRVLTALLILYVAVRLGLRFPQEWAAR